MTNMSAQPSATKPPRERLRVLIADDSPVTRRSTQLMVSLIPALELVAVATTGREAVELAHTHKVDIALLDVKMPEMDGLQATQNMLRRNPNMVCVMLSAESDHETLRRAVDVGARDYLIKPYTSEQFLTMLKPIVDEMHGERQRTQAHRQTQIQAERHAVLVGLATTYIKTRRTDSRAMLVFEHLALEAECEMRWLRHLCFIYVVRGEWGKLEKLAARLAAQTAVDLP